MNQPTQINQTTFRILYFRYKDYFIPVSVIIVCIFLFIFVIVPQIQTWVSLRDDTITEQNKIATINKNLTFISQLDQSTLTKQLALASIALPQEKSFEQVLNAVSQAAVNAQVSLGDYSFIVGDVSKTQLKPTNLQMIITVNGGILDVQKYLVQLKSQLPLSEVSEIHVSPSGSTITTIFYYKTITQVPFTDTQAIPPLTKKDQDLLKQLQVFQQNAILKQ